MSNCSCRQPCNCHKKNCNSTVIPNTGKCENVIFNWVFADHTLEETLENFTNSLGPLVFPTDGTTSLDNAGLLVDAPIFTSTLPVGNEHVKNLRYYRNSFALSDSYETLYETLIAVQQHIPIESLPAPFAGRIRNIDEDIRLCSGAMNTLDIETFTVMDIFLSNDKIFCFVERLPFGKTVENNYAAYSAGIAVAGRGGDPLNDFVKLGIGMRKSSAKFYVNGELVFTVPRYGVRQLDEYRMLDHQGEAEALQLKSSFFGFGLFTLLDMQLPYDYARQLVVNDFSTNQAASGLVQLDLAANYGETLPGLLDGDDRPIVDPTVTWAVQLGQFPNDNHDIKLFGQGATLRIKYFKVTVRC